MAIEAEAEYGMPELRVRLVRKAQERLPDTPEGRAYRDRWGDFVSEEAFLGDDRREVVPAHRMLDILTPSLKIRRITVKHRARYQDPLLAPHSPFVDRALGYLTSATYSLAEEAWAEERPRTPTAWVEGHLARHHEHPRVAELLAAMRAEAFDGLIDLLELNALAAWALCRHRYGIKPLADRLQSILEQLAENPSSGGVRAVAQQLRAHAGDPRADELIVRAQRVLMGATTDRLNVQPLAAAVRSALADCT